MYHSFFSIFLSNTTDANENTSSFTGLEVVLFELLDFCFFIVYYSVNWFVSFVYSLGVVWTMILIEKMLLSNLFYLYLLKKV